MCFAIWLASRGGLLERVGMVLVYPLGTLAHWAADLKFKLRHYLRVLSVDFSTLHQLDDLTQVGLS